MTRRSRIGCISSTWLSMCQLISTPHYCVDQYYRHVVALFPMYIYLLIVSASPLDWDNSDDALITGELLTCHKSRLEPEFKSVITQYTRVINQWDSKTNRNLSWPACLTAKSTSVITNITTQLAELLSKNMWEHFYKTCSSALLCHSRINTFVKRGGSVVRSVPWVRRVEGSNPTLGATSRPWANP